MDRRFENLKPYLPRDAEPPLGFEDSEDWEDDGNHLRRSSDRGYRTRNSSFGNHDGWPEYRGRRDSKNRSGSVLDQHSNHNQRAHSRGYDQSFYRTMSCGDPPQRFHSNVCTEATNWISRVQHTVELADTQADRAIQHQPPANQRRQWQSRDRRGHSGFSPIQQSFQQSATAGQNLGTSGKHSENPQPPLVRVSQAEKAERARTGLCYFCPEKWVIGHVCTHRFLCYADEDDQLAELEEINAKLEETVAADVSHIHAMKGSTLDVPNNESMEEIVKTDNIPLHALVGVYDEKIGEEEETLLEDKDETLLEDKDETLLEDKEGNGTVGGVEKIIASFKVAQMSSTDVKIIAYFYVDLHISTVASMNFCSALLDADARLIPPRMDTRCLSIRARVDKILVSALNYHEAALVIFDGDNEGRCSIVWCAFDPGGDILVEVHKVVLSSWIEVYGNPSESKDFLIQIKSYWGTKQQFCVFDPGGDALHSFFYQRSSWLLVSTLRTRRILTEGELIRSFI